MLIPTSQNWFCRRNPGWYDQVSTVNGLSQDWVETDGGRYRIGSASERGGGGYTALYVIVQYENNTDTTFRSVTIRASAIDENDRIIGTNTRSWFDFSEGPIRPGFQGIQEIPIEVDEGRTVGVRAGLSWKE